MICREGIAFARHYSNKIYPVAVAAVDGQRIGHQLQWPTYRTPAAVADAPDTSCSGQRTGRQLQLANVPETGCSDQRTGHRPQ